MNFVHQPLVPTFSTVGLPTRGGTAAHTKPSAYYIPSSGYLLRRTKDPFRNPEIYPEAVQGVSTQAILCKECFETRIIPTNLRVYSTHYHVASMNTHALICRYFYYQIANIYVTVTAGSIWESINSVWGSNAADVCTALPVFVVSHTRTAPYRLSSS
jgi:hypothetical protein